ncbi:DUF6891 domain-containing protein [Streptomyces sp. NPDC001407]|uniref:DUF6891 domain-containing protein n=1 Tax=Streptomyces sp. NPDC001407 TaxID=3364573 RepID=UPI0036B4AA6B
MLPITVNTESGEVRSGIGAEELGRLIGRLGADGDRFVVAERTADESGGDHYLQTWHEGAGPYEVEYREGSAERHFGVRMASADEVAAVFVAWARGTEGWSEGYAWERVELGEEDPGSGLGADFADVPVAELEAELGPRLLKEAEGQVRLLIRCGFDEAEDIADEISDHFHADGATPLPVATARRIVGRLWRERLAEQADWPEVTDADRVEAAFAALDSAGITARMHFTCCSRCGFAEIGGEAAEGDHGFVFFHSQDTRAAVEGQEMWLSYGTHASGDREAVAEVGRDVVDALTEAGLTVSWDGDPERSISLAGLDWRRRVG